MKKLFFKIFFLALAVMLSISSIAQQAIWSVPKNIDTPKGTYGDNGQFTSMAIVDGNPAMVYYDMSHNNLMYMRANDADGTTWGDPLVIAEVGDIGRYCSLNVIQGIPAVSFYDETNKDLMFVCASDLVGSLWLTPITVDAPGAVGKFTSLCEVMGTPAIAYYDESNMALKYVHAYDPAGNAWEFPITIGSGFVGMHASMTIVAGNPAVAFYDLWNGGLRYSRSFTPSGSAWGSGALLDEKISNGNINVGEFCSLSVIDGKPAISYFALTNGDLKYISATNPTGNGAWNAPLIIDATGIVGKYTSLNTVDGNPAIAYNDDNNALKFVRSTNVGGTAWGTPQSIDAVNGQFASLRIVNGNPAIAYHNANAFSKDVKYIRATDASGTAWGTAQSFDLTGDLGSYTSLAVVKGNPAVSYYDASKGDLKYVRATNDDGTTWGTPQTIDSNNNVGQITSLAVVNGNPAIAYYYPSNTDFKFIRATDSTGSAWGTQQTIDGSTYSGFYSSLAIVNGNPAVSYYRDISKDLRFARANDANGTSWGAPQDIDIAGDVGGYTSLCIVNGNPAISYYDVTNGDLKYVRATDASGSSWGSPLTIDATGNVGQFTSLLIVNGFPTISYYDVSNGNLKLVRATDVNGSVWGSPLVIDSIGDIGQYTSLSIVYGNPAISYYDVTNGDLKFVKATNIDGSVWGNSEVLASGISTGQYTSMKTLGTGNTGIAFFDAGERWPMYTTSNQCTPNTGVHTASACDSYYWIDGNNYTSSNNTATYTLTNVAGCDSVVTLNLIINYSTASTDVQAACDTYTWIDGNVYTSSNNTATHTLINAAGCDSVVTLNLTVNNSTASTDAQAACDTYTWIDGNTYTSSNNTATYTLTNAVGCDSIVTLNLTIKNSTASTDVQVACETYTWIDGNTYTSSNNTATYTLTNALGCDSIVTLNLTIKNSTASTDVQVACDEYTWIDGNYYTSSNNTATYTLTNAAGCDSVVTLNLTINSSSSSSQNITACNSFTWINGITYTSSSMASYTIPNTAGCDSSISLFLTINTVDVTVTDNSPMLTSNAPVLGHQYQWIDCNNNNLPISGETYQSFTALTNGVYAVIVTGNCTDTSACINVTGLGVNEVAKNSITIYPNPTTGWITITNNLDNKGIVEIINLQGKVVYKNTMNDNVQMIDLSAYSKDIFFVVVTTTKGVEVQKIVIQ